MNNAEAVCSLVEEIRKLIYSNITPDGQCRFDPVKTRLALELVKTEIEKSMHQEAD